MHRTVKEITRGGAGEGTPSPLRRALLAFPQGSRAGAGDFVEIAREGRGRQAGPKRCSPILPRPFPPRRRGYTRKAFCGHHAPVWCPQETLRPKITPDGSVLTGESGQRYTSRHGECILIYRKLIQERHQSLDVGYGFSPSHLYLPVGDDLDDQRELIQALGEEWI